MVAMNLLLMPAELLIPEGRNINQTLLKQANYIMVRTQTNQQIHIY